MNFNLLQANSILRADLVGGQVLFNLGSNFFFLIFHS